MRFEELKNLSRIHAKLGLHRKLPESQYQAPESPLIRKDFQECQRRPLRGPRGVIHGPWCELTTGLARTSCHWRTVSSRLMEILVGKSYRSGETGNPHAL